MELGKLFRKEKKYAQALELFKSVVERKSSYFINRKSQVDKKTQIPPYENRIKQFRKKKIEDIVFPGYFYLGFLFENGLGVTKSFTKALEYYEIASKLVGKASYNIAVIYFKGLLGKNDFVKAKYWCFKGISKGVKKCAPLLGVLYFNGLGVKKNYKEAIKWFKLASNDARSKFHLAYIHLNIFISALIQV